MMPTRQWGLNEGQLRTLAILVVAVFGFYLCYRLVRPFLPSLTLALTLAVMLLPVHRRIEAHLPWPSLAASITVTIAAVAVVGPGLFILHQLGREAAIGADYLEKSLRNAEWRQVAMGYPRLAEVVVWLEQRLNPAGILGDLATWLTARSSMLLRGSVVQLVNGLLTFYLLFYFLRDRRQALAALADLSPLSDAETGAVIDRFTDTVYATVFGTVVVAAVQGALSGLMFWWLGLASPLFWGLVMGLLAIIPVLGAFVVWIPAAMFLALEGEWVKALVLTAWGAGLVGTIDNLLYPVLVGNRMRLHTIPTFVGVVGGVLVFGVPGLILGPTIIAVTRLLLEILKQRFSAPAG